MKKGKLLIPIVAALCIVSCHDDEIKKSIQKERSYPVVAGYEEIYYDKLGKGKAETIQLFGRPAEVVNMGDYYLFQGDIRLKKDDQSSGGRSQGAAIDGKRWTNGIVYYKINSGLPAQQRVADAITMIDNATNGISFVPRTTQADYVEIVRSTTGTYSDAIGQVGGRQEIGLEDAATYGNVIHELLHCLGSFHEHAREDRDDQIIVNLSVMDNQAEKNSYAIYSNGYDEGLFDFGSIMLLSSIYKNGGYTMVKKSDSQPFVAQRTGLSTADIDALNERYKVIVESSGSVVADTEFDFADVNGDGKADKIYWRHNANSGDVRVALATSGGQFSSTYVHSSGSANTNAKFFFSDINGDGKADKIYWRYDNFGGDIRVALATTNGSFSSTYLHSSGSESSNTKFSFADVNGDGQSDKIYWRYDHHNGDVRVALATSNGSFSTTYVHSTGSNSSNAKLYFGKIDVDSKADKIFWGYDSYGGEVRTTRATTNGNFDDNDYNFSSGSSSSDTKFYFADVNGDGRADKVYWQYDKYEGDTRVFKAHWFDPLEAVFHTKATQTGGSSSNLTKMYYADVDGNGKADRIYWNYSHLDGAVRVFLEP